MPHLRPIRFPTSRSRTALVAASALALALAGTALRATTADAAPASAAAAAPAAAVTAAATTGSGKDWLHTKGNQIVDAAGNPVWLTGANWFGFNASERVFHGLWSANIEDLTKGMADHGINLVRVPISTQLLLEWKSGGGTTDKLNTVHNPELAGMSSLQVFDYWLKLCEKYGLKVLLDVHSAEADNSGHEYPVWYKGSITAEQFYSAWEWVAARYKDNDTIVAADIKNEPHGKQGESPRAKWDGSTDQDNWKNACQVAGRRILAVNPELLILCEGIGIYPRPGVSWSSTGLGDYFNTWWGGNLRGAREYPVDLGADQDQLVYSPHDYGPLVYDQPWFQRDFDKTTLTDDVWRPNWLYLHENGTAPLLVGEWGGRIGQDTRQDKWLTALRDLIVQYRLHQTFWCLNPNSGDTGGLLTDDWQSWDETKYKLLKPALWQYQGKFVGLDHQVPLGGEGTTTGITTAQRYAAAGPDLDTQAPTAPSGLAAGEVTASTAALSWKPASDDSGVAAYEVLRATGGGTATVVATVSATSYTATKLEPGTAYTFSVRARDAAGNVSAASAGVSVTTEAAAGNAGCTAVYKVDQGWNSGFTGQVTVTNTSGAAVTGWTVTWTNPAGNSIDSIWGAVLSTKGQNVTVTNAKGNGAIAAGGSTSFGFVGSGSATAPDSIGCSTS